MKKPYVIGFAAKKSSQKSSTIWFLSEYFENSIMIDADTRKADLMAMNEERQRGGKYDPLPVSKATNGAEIKKIVDANADKDWIFVDTRGALDEPKHMRDLYNQCDMLICPVACNMESHSFPEMLQFVHNKHNYRVLIHSDDGVALKEERAKLRATLDKIGAPILTRSYPDTKQANRLVMNGWRFGDSSRFWGLAAAWKYRELAKEIKKEAQK